MRCDDPSLANLATGNGRGLEGDAPRICSTSTEGAASCRKLPSRTRCTFGPPLPAEEAGCEAAVSNGFAFASSCIRRSAFSTAENTCPIGMFVLKGKQDVKTARLGMALGTAGRSARSTLSNTLWLTFFWSPRYPRSSKAFRQDLLFRTSPMVVFKAFISKVMSQRRRPLRIASFWQVVHNIFLNKANK